MHQLFAGSYTILAALLAWEVFTVHTILRKAAKIRVARGRRRREAASRILMRIPWFRSRLFGADAVLTASDLKGESTALLFVDQDVESARSMHDMQALLRRMHKDRGLFLFVCTRRDEISVDTSNLLSLAGRFSSRCLKSIYDRDFAIAKKFRIDAFPTLLLVGPDGRVQRTWTNLHICYDGNNQRSDTMSVAPAVTRPSTEAGI